MRSAQPAALLLVLGGIGGATLAQSVDEGDNMLVVRDIAYAEIDDTTLAFDLYMPGHFDQAPPLLVWVHGGAWQFGSRESVEVIDLVQHGFAIASVSYRLTPVASFPAQIHDIKGAIRYLRASAAQYGYDASRIVVGGPSAGGHLAALVAVTNGSAVHEGTVGGFRETSSDVQALVSYFGASNLTSILDQSTPFGLGVRIPSLELLLGGPIDERGELARQASPVFFVDENDPPMYLLHGDQDPQMPISQTHELHGAAKAAGIKAVFDVVHGARHGGPEFYTPSRTANVAAFLHEALGSGNSTSL